MPDVRNTIVGRALPDGGVVGPLETLGNKILYRVGWSGTDCTQASRRSWLISDRIGMIIAKGPCASVEDGDRQACQALADWLDAHGMPDARTAPKSTPVARSVLDKLGARLYQALQRHELLDEYYENSGIVVFGGPETAACALRPESLGALVRVRPCGTFEQFSSGGWIADLPKQCVGHDNVSPEIAVARALLLALGEEG
jgi:hypothetical protein